MAYLRKWAWGWYRVEKRVEVTRPLRWLAWQSTPEYSDMDREKLWLRVLAKPNVLGMHFCCTISRSARRDWFGRNPRKVPGIMRPCSRMKEFGREIFGWIYHARYSYSFLHPPRTYLAFLNITKPGLYTAKTRTYYSSHWSKKKQQGILMLAQLQCPNEQTASIKCNADVYPKLQKS